MCCNRVTCGENSGVLHFKPPFPCLSCASFIVKPLFCVDVINARLQRVIELFVLVVEAVQFFTFYTKNKKTKEKHTDKIYITFPTKFYNRQMYQVD